MASTTIIRLIADLLHVVNALAGYPEPSQLPLVEFVSHARLEAMACEEPCEVRGWYAGGSTIFLDDRLDPQANMWDRGIVVHEIVHYLQDEAGAFGTLSACQRWVEREAEAFDVQRQWLQANPPNRPPPRYARFPRIAVDCNR